MSNCDNCSTAIVPVEQDRAPTPLIQCKVCDALAYCSVECQIEDAPLHNTLCTEYNTFILTKLRPSALHRVALLLPSGPNSPHFIYLKVNLQGGYGETPILENLLGSDHPKSQSITFPIPRNNDEESKGGRGMSWAVVLEFRATGDEDGLDLNQCVERFTAGQGVKNWMGPMLITLKMGLGEEPSFYSDLNLSYMSKVRELLKTYLASEQQVQGVEIRCRGEHMTLGRAEFSAVAVDKTHKMFSMDGLESRIIPVTKNMGIPLVIINLGNVDYASQNLTKAQKKQMEGDVMFTKNTASIFLTLDTDISSQRWGSLDMNQWGDDTRNVLVARGD